MADFGIQIPDDQVTRVVSALCWKFGYEAEIPDPSNPSQTIPNPETPDQFGRRQIIEFLLQSVRDCERARAIAVATKALEDAQNYDPVPPPIL